MRNWKRSQAARAARGAGATFRSASRGWRRWTNGVPLPKLTQSLKE